MRPERQRSLQRDIAADMSSRGKEAATKEHYDQVPFDVVDESQEALEAFQIPPLRDFIDTIGPDDRLLDAGCGAGRTTIYAHLKGLRVIGFELSSGSLKSIKSRYPVALVQASNLGLPFRTDSFDAIISDGVIPYTDEPRAALEETLRVLKEDGRLFVALYKRDHYYYYLYTYVGGILRFILERVPLGDRVLDLTFLPLYHALRNVLRASRASSWRRSRALFYDYFLAPTIRFYTRDEIVNWAQSMGARCTRYDRCPGWNAHTFFIEKDRAVTTAKT